MRIPFAVALLLTALVGPAGAAESANRRFLLTNATDARALQEIATTLRSVGDIRQISIDMPSGSMSVSGTPDQVAAAAWLVQQLDVPARGKGKIPENQTTVLGPGDVYLVYHLQQASINLGVQEIITTIRTVASVQRVYTYSAAAAIAVRGNAAEIAMAEWLMNQLDLPSQNVPGASREYRNPGAPVDVLRVFYLPQQETARGLQQLVTAIRTTGQIMRVYDCAEPRAIAVRDTETRVALAEQLVNGWAKP